MSSSGLSSKQLGRAREALKREAESGKTPGAVTLIYRRGETHVETAGLADIASATPMQRDTIFRIASMTKPVTAVAAMILVEETKLRLDDPVDPWLPELAGRRVLASLGGPATDTVPANRAITLRDLLTLRFGFGVLMAPPGRYPVQALIAEAGFAPGPIPPLIPNDQWMANLGRLPLLHQPGEKWMYHTGLDVAGVLIARVAGSSLGEFMQQRIFDPLGMQDTGFSVPESKVSRLSTCYAQGPNGNFNTFDPGQGGFFTRPPVFEAGGGGLVSTADDFLLFAKMMLHQGRLGSDRILSRPSVELITTDHITPQQKAVSPFSPGFWDTDGWGLGLSITTHTNTVGPKPGSYGWIGGCGTSWRNDPKEEMVTMFLNQRMMTRPDDFQSTIDFTTLAYSAIDD